MIVALLEGLPMALLFVCFIFAFAKLDEIRDLLKKQNSLLLDISDKQDPKLIKDIEQNLREPD